MNKGMLRASGNGRTTPMEHKYNKKGGDVSALNRKYQLNMCMQHFKEKRASFFSEYRASKTPVKEIHINTNGPSDVCDLTPDTSKESLSLFTSPSSTSASFSCLAKKLLHEVRNGPADQGIGHNGNNSGNLPLSVHTTHAAYSHILNQSVCGLKDHSDSSPIKYSNNDSEMAHHGYMHGSGYDYAVGLDLDGNVGTNEMNEREQDLHCEAMEILYGSGEEDFDDVQLLSELESLLKNEYDQCSLQCYLESVNDDYLIEQYELDRERITGNGLFEMEHGYNNDHSGSDSDSHSRALVPPPIEGSYSYTHTTHTNAQMYTGAEGIDIDIGRCEGVDDVDGELLCPCCQSHIMHPLVSTDMNMGIINPSSDQACDMLFCFNCSASMYIHSDITHMKNVLSSIYEKHACNGKHCHIHFRPHGKGQIEARCDECNFSDHL